MKHKVAKDIAKDIASTTVDHIKEELQNLGFKVFTIHTINFFGPLLFHTIYLYLIHHYTRPEITSAIGYAQSPFRKEAK